MASTTYYVVRHRRTGVLLPARVCATRFDFERTTEEPRLFNTERAAKNCATSWAQGVWTQRTHTESEGWEYPSYTCVDPPAPAPVPGRSRDALEVLPVTLQYPAG